MKKMKIKELKEMTKKYKIKGRFKKPLIYKRKTKKRVKKDFIELKKDENLDLKKIYEEMKKNFGNCGSWAVWDTENYKHLDYIMNKDVSNEIQNKYVLIGLNISRPIKEVYGNFHSAFNDKSTTATNANKLFYSLYNTPLWGSYMTDIIKYHKDPTSTNVVKYLKKNPEKMKKHIETFEKELNILENKNPILITMGKDTYKIVKKYLPKFKIYNIPHYATQWSTKKYIEKVHTEIEKITKMKILENNKITLFKMNIKELKQESKKRGLKRISKLRKIEIIKILEKN